MCQLKLKLETFTKLDVTKRMLKIKQIPFDECLQKWQLSFLRNMCLDFAKILTQVALTKLMKYKSIGSIKIIICH